jgi:GT2 family glycosyltransferase
MESKKHNISAIDIDIIIISYAYDIKKRELTEQTIQSLLESESSEKFNMHIYVIESEKSSLPYNYPNTKMIKPTEKFGYHKYLNIGVREGKSPWLVLANNDLIFKKGWLTAIMEAREKDPDLVSFGTWCDRFHNYLSISKQPVIQYGNRVGIHVTGWLLVLTRKVYDQMNGLDENFIFWYCDNDYMMTLKKLEIKHALITNSEVLHVASQTIVEMDAEKHRKMTLLPNLYFDYKWNHKSYIVYLFKHFVFWLIHKMKKA